jgi:RimJ/RimL family protein N-acetyltransferase
MTTVLFRQFRILRIERIGRALKGRILHQGFIKTFSYLLNTYLLPRIGVRISHVYVAKGSEIVEEASELKDIDLAIEYSLEQITPSDLEGMRYYQGAEFILRAAKYLGNGDCCVIARNQDGAFVGMLWIHRLGFPDEGSFVVRDAYVRPMFRGRNCLPAMVAAARQEFVACQSGRGIVFYARINMGNYASMRAFKKAGFRYSWTMVQLFKRQTFLIGGQSSGMIDRRNIP